MPEGVVRGSCQRKCQRELSAEMPAGDGTEIWSAAQEEELGGVGAGKGLEVGDFLSGEVTVKANRPKGIGGGVEGERRCVVVLT